MNISTTGLPGRKMSAGETKFRLLQLGMILAISLVFFVACKPQFKDKDGNIEITTEGATESLVELFIPLYTTVLGLKFVVNPENLS